MSSFDAKKTAAAKRQEQQKLAKIRAKAQKEVEKQKRQKERLKEMKRKSMEGQEAAKKREVEKLKQLTPEELKRQADEETRAQALMEKLALEKEEESERKKVRRSEDGWSGATTERTYHLSSRKEPSARRSAPHPNNLPLPTTLLTIADSSQEDGRGPGRRVPVQREGEGEEE